MAVFLHMETVGFIALLVHPPGVPVSMFGLALRSPMGPDAELGIAEPVWHAVLFQGFPVGSERVFSAGGPAPAVLQRSRQWRRKPERGHRRRYFPDERPSLHDHDLYLLYKY